MKKIPIRQITSGGEIKTPGMFSIRKLQEVLHGKELVHELHKHDFYFFLIVQKGSGIHEIDFIKYPVHDDSFFILRPGQVHRLEISANSNGFLMEFDPGFYQPKNNIALHRWKKASAKNYCELEAARFMKLYNIMSSIYNEFLIKDESYIDAVKANLDLLFIEFTRQSSDTKAISKTGSGYTQERFEELVALLETNIGTMKNASDYAGLLNLSLYQLNAITKTSVGKTVSDLINEQILLEAKRYLLATPGQVKDIADHLGYEDVSYFIRFFKKHTGFSPDVFRKNFT